MRYVLALILVAGLAATVNADATTWFSLESDAAAAAADKGLDLTIDYDMTATAAETITVYQWVETEGMSLSGVSCDLEYVDDSGFFSIDNLVCDIGGWMIIDTPTYDADGVWAYGRSLLFGAPIATGTVTQVASFELTLNYGGVAQDHFINTGVGSQAWVSVEGDPFRIFHGDDATGIYNDDYSTMTPAIGVVIPEPTTLALLGFGALALIRRR